MDGSRAILSSRLNILKNSLAGIREEPPLKIIFITILTISFWFGSLYLFYRGLSFFYGFPVVGPVLMDEVLYIFFAVLFIMLFLSAVIVCQGTFFNAREVGFLFSKPVNHRVIYFYRLAQSTLYSSWAFLFLGIPFLIAYAMVKNTSVLFYLAIPFWFAGFVVLPTAAAALLVLGAVRVFHYENIKYYFMVAVALLAAALFWHYKTTLVPEFRESDDIGAFMDTFLYHLRILKHSFYPGYWMASSILHAGSNRIVESLQYFFVYAATSILILQAGWICSGNLYYQAWLASRNRSAQSIPHPDQGFANRIISLFSFLPRTTAAMITKDIKIFARDFSQWSQFAIYLAILGVYIFNLRAMPASIDNPYWKLIVTFLNFSAASLVLAGFSVRFLFPQISLEGSKIWILGLAPISFRGLVIQKFFVNFFIIFLVSEALMVATNLMINTPPGLFIVSCAMTAFASVGLTGLAIGLGALYPDFKEDNPSRIVSSFGGTLNFIAALVYIFSMAALFAVPYFAYEIHGSITRNTFTAILTGSWIGAGAATVLAGVLPLVLGYRKLQHREF